MRIEKLNENKIRIFLNLQDLKEKNIDLHTFMSNSVENQDLFLDMLSQAEEEVGFKTKNYRLIIEALASSDGCFVLTITREKPDIVKQKIKQPKVKRKSTFLNTSLSIYMFNTFDEFCEFCTYINSSHLSNSLNKLKNTSLVLFQNKYYLVLNSIKLTTSELKNFTYTISEFAEPTKNEVLFERKLREYGSVIIGKNAILTCLKYFDKIT